MNFVARACCSAVALSLLAPSIAGAQDRGNPFASLFGRPPERTGREFTSLDFRTTAGVQLAEVVGDDLSAGSGDMPPGVSAAADATLQLRHVGDRIQTHGHARYAYQEYRREPAFGAPAYDAGGQVVVKATNRLLFDASGRFVRSPFFHLVDTPAFAIGQLTTLGDPFIAQLLGNDNVDAQAGVTANYSRRSSINLSGSWRETRFQDSPNDNFSSRGFRGQWKRQMSRDIGARVGYGREEVRQRRLGDSHFMNEMIDIGIDYSKALPIARRTSLSFSTETSMLRDNIGGRHYRLNGSLNLQHGFQRTWRAGLGAFRATEFMPGIPLPVFSDRLSAQLSGYLSKRFIIHGHVDGSRNQIGFTDSGGFLTYSGNARLTFAMTRHVGIFGQYVYYHYQLPLDANSVVQLPTLSRQSYSFGLQTWLPLIDKDKVTRDPR